eukprot:TRINITY_DN5944_c0_g1_i7.p1 TRINITY_DN5944_c0_g1~~TRINITY_DN5944_c0_g1_i7.p1  ORF type:complete len:534 (-),score=78.55 TRINITY_DN5944_c0_g1_i7:192-1604(-)
MDRAWPPAPRGVTSVTTSTASAWNFSSIQLPGPPPEEGRFSQQVTKLHGLRASSRSSSSSSHSSCRSDSTMSSGGSTSSSSQDSTSSSDSSVFCAEVIRRPLISAWPEKDVVGTSSVTSSRRPSLDCGDASTRQQHVQELHPQQQQQTQQQQREAQQQQEQQRHQNQHQRSYRGRSRHGFSPLVGRRRSSGARLRRNSQQRFRDREQTFIVLDWDNTLFPTTYRAQAKDCDPAKIAECQRKAVKLVSLAACLGKVIIVTLGDYEWLARCFAKYYIDFGMLVERLRIPILYARTDEDKELTYVDMKQQAIAGEIAAYYSAYNGQSWKNVISIGDSDYERVATWRATSDYVAELREKAGQPLPLVSTSSPCTLGAAESNSNSMEVDVDGHFHKVRCKTLKLVERPSADDLALELEHMLHWMPLIVGADSSLDLAVSDVRNISELKSIWETLHSVRRASSVSSFLERVSARTR